ncbi:site-specific DNA-methyltransferase [Flavobacteriaceae bacterium R38]|nr:site-specific DNA-methyltransferase [Flavobacteriaceae bacterium R38]
MGRKKEILYRITKVSDAKKVATEYLKQIELESVVKFGLPEIDDRYHIWRVPLLNANKERLGEVVIDAKTSFIVEKKTTAKEILEKKLLGRNKKKSTRKKSTIPKISNLNNTIGFGDCIELLQQTPKESVDLVFTSPPYYNARPEYSEYHSYEEYLMFIRKVIRESNRVLNEGRFFVMNISPVLLRRTSRNTASKRIAVPFDFHRLFIEEGFDFIDDIHWVKPEGAGWATGRGRRFSADRNPLQYKPVPVTEYLLVYRKQTDKLIDWHIRKHPDKELVQQSKIQDGYQVTNLWKIHPSYNKNHPAVFPVELAKRVIEYYSFVNDVVLDPFGGSGTTGKGASELKRRFVLFEKEEKYLDLIKKDIKKWNLQESEIVNWINTEAPELPNQKTLF